MRLVMSYSGDAASSALPLCRDPLVPPGSGSQGYPPPPRGVPATQVDITGGGRGGGVAARGGQVAGRGHGCSEERGGGEVHEGQGGVGGGLEGGLGREAARVLRVRGWGGATLGLGGGASAGSGGGGL